jgi:hypothetical protein
MMMRLASCCPYENPVTKEKKMMTQRLCDRLLVLAFSNNVFQRLMREMSEEEILANGSIDFATGLVSTARLKTEDSCCCWTTACHYYYHYYYCYCKSHPDDY